MRFFFLSVLILCAATATAANRLYIPNNHQQQSGDKSRNDAGNHSGYWDNHSGYWDSHSGYWDNHSGSQSGQSGSQSGQSGGQSGQSTGPNTNS
jgi:hypothetical protein